MSSVNEFVLLLLICQVMPLLLAAGYQGGCPPSFTCGYVGNITFPFTIPQRLDCGFLPIHNCNDPLMPKLIQSKKDGKSFPLILVAQLLSNKTTPLTTLQLRDNNLYELLQNESCEAFRNNYTVPLTSRFANFDFTFNVTLFRCNRTLHVNPPSSMYNYTKCPDYDLYYSYKQVITGDDDQSSLTACTKVQLPIKDVADAKSPFTFVTGDITIKVELTNECADCHYRQQGQCIFDDREKFCCANGILQQKPWRHKHP